MTNQSIDQLIAQLDQAFAERPLPSRKADQGTPVMITEYGDMVPLDNQHLIQKGCGEWLTR
jgi:hypothetical protein